MQHSITLQPAYILHARSYRDTSYLLELFTHEHGRVSAVARGARGARSRYKGLLQPFVPLLVSWYGRSELMTLSAAEPNGMPHSLNGDILLCGLYINELLMRLLHRYDSHPLLFQAYQRALLTLPKQHSQHIVLREFEKQLLGELGYALQLDRETHTGVMVHPEQSYHFDPHHGLSSCMTLREGENSYSVFSGKSLLALHKGEFEQENYLRDAKRLLRIALRRLLGDKPIKSRELFLNSMGSGLTP